MGGRDHVVQGRVMWEGPCSSGEGYVGERDYVIQGGLCGWEGPCSSGEGYVDGRDHVVQGRVMWEGPCSSGEGYVGGRDPGRVMSFLQLTKLTNGIR